MRYRENMSKLKELLEFIRTYTEHTKVESIDEVETTIDLFTLIFDNIDRFSIPKDINDLGEMLSINLSNENDYVISNKVRSYNFNKIRKITSDFINFYDMKSDLYATSKAEPLIRMDTNYEKGDKLLSSALFNELVETISDIDPKDSIVGRVEVYKSKDNYQHYGILFHLNEDKESLFATLVLD